MLLRVFETTAGGAERLQERLQAIATSMIQARRLEAVQLCRYADHPGRIVWIQDRPSARRLGPGLARQGEPCCADAEASLAHADSQAFELVDGFYHYPLPRCRVWSLMAALPAARESELIARLLDLSRTVAATQGVAGMSVYRSIGPARRVLLFVALDRDRAPSEPLQLPAEIGGGWNALLVVWTMGRMTLLSDPRGQRGPGLYPRATFWARDLPVLAVETAQEGP